MKSRITRPEEEQEIQAPWESEQKKQMNFSFTVMPTDAQHSHLLPCVSLPRYQILEKENQNGLDWLLSISPLTATTRGPLVRNASQKKAK